MNKLENAKTSRATASPAVTSATSRTPVPPTPTGSPGATAAARKATQRSAAWPGKFKLTNPVAQFPAKGELLQEPKTIEGMTDEMTGETIDATIEEMINVISLIVRSLLGMEEAATKGATQEILITKETSEMREDGLEALNQHTEEKPILKETLPTGSGEVLQGAMKTEGLETEAEVEATRETTTTTRVAGQNILEEAEAVVDRTGAMREATRTTRERGSTRLDALWNELSLLAFPRNTTSIHMRM